MGRPLCRPFFYGTGKKIKLMQASDLYLISKKIKSHKYRFYTCISIKIRI